MGEGSTILTDPYHTPTFIQPSTQPQKTQQPRKPKRKDIQVPQPSDPIESFTDKAIHKELGDSLVRAATTASSLEAEQNNGAKKPWGILLLKLDEAVHKELGDSLVRAATTASRLEAEQDSGGGPRCQEAMGDTAAQTRFGSVFKHSNDSLLTRGNTLRSDEDRLKLDELMASCTTLQNRVLDLEKTKTTQHNEITSLKRRVKKLEKKNRSRTHRLKRLYKVGLTARVESSDDKEKITLINVHDINVSAGEEVVEEVVEVINTTKLIIDVAQVNVVGDIVSTVNAATTTTTTITTVDDITLAQAFEEMKNTKPKKKGDKGKGILIELVKLIKKKYQIRLDEETALNLQAEFDEEERLAREKAEKEKKVNIALIETCDDIQAKIDAEKRRKHFAAKRAKEKRNKSSTKAQQRKIMYTYLKNMEGYKLNDLKVGGGQRKESRNKAGTRDYKEATRPVEDLDLLLCGDLKTMFEPHAEDKVWKNQQEYKVLNWKLYDSCGVHSLMMQHVQIYMLVEKKYPLTQSTLSMMLENKLIIDYESKMAYQLLKFIMKQLKK
ncbi:hypothetical protein Tco_0802751 [Tanacetum coccineum]|uniref:Uncharacterized protein n=1 Tax=Tanacetum coccineum TaxID=301880 RepID=A0ABQ5A423_9ASTR